MEITAKNEGQRQLFLTGDSLSKIAKIAGVSRTVAHRWRHGEQSPTDEQRAAIFSAYGIPVYAWDTSLPDIKVEATKKMRGAGRPTKEEAEERRANPVESHRSEDPDLQPKRRVFAQSSDGETIPKPPYPPRPDSSASGLAHVQYQLDCIRHDLEWEPLSVAGKSKLRADETRAMNALLKYKKEQEMSEDRYVREHPAWARFTSRLLSALEPFPNASKAVVEALTAIEE